MNPNGPMVMMPNVSFDNEPVKHVLTIKPGNNGWAVFVEEDVKVKRSLNINDVKNNIGEFIDSINKQGSDDVVQKVIRENDKKTDPDAPLIIALGMYVFKKIEDMQAFISFVYENQVKTMNEAEAAAKAAEKILKPVFNSQMQTKP